MKLASASFLNPTRAKRLSAPSIVIARAQTSYIVAAFELGNFITRRRVADDIVLSDASLWSLLKGVDAETVLLSDQFAYSRYRQVLDLHRLSDSTYRTVSKVIIDQIRASETVAFSWSRERGLFSATAISDAARLAFERASQDAVSVSDDLLAELIAGRLFTDTFVLSPSSEVVYKEFTSARVEQLTATDVGSLRSQSYVDPAYLSEDYVGASRSF